MLYSTQEINFTCLILRSLWASENGQNLLLKWHPRGANNVMISLIQEQWRTYVYYICRYSTYPIYVVSINLFCWPPSVDIFNILPGFLWQPLLNEGVNGVNRLATKGKKYYGLPTKRAKKLPTPNKKDINRLSTWTEIRDRSFFTRYGGLVGFGGRGGSHAKNGLKGGASQKTGRKGGDHAK